MNNLLSDYAQKGGDLKRVQGIVQNWYQMFLNEKAQRSAPVQNVQPVQSVQNPPNVQSVPNVQGVSNVPNAQSVPKVRKRAPVPPTLESTRGGGYEGRRNVSMKDFRNFDPDAQAQALMDMGIV